MLSQAQTGYHQHPASQRQSNPRPLQNSRRQRSPAAADPDIGLASPHTHCTTHCSV